MSKTGVDSVWTPCHCASSGKHHELARTLLGVDAKSEEPLSLHEASVEGNVGFARTLLECGASLSAL
jgi:hypothetical protein